MGHRGSTPGGPAPRSRVPGPARPVRPGRRTRRTRDCREPRAVVPALRGGRRVALAAEVQGLLPGTRVQAQRAASRSKAARLMRLLNPESWLLAAGAGRGRRGSLPRRERPPPQTRASTGGSGSTNARHCARGHDGPASLRSLNCHPCASRTACATCCATRPASARASTSASPTWLELHLAPSTRSSMSTPASRCSRRLASTRATRR